MAIPLQRIPSLHFSFFLVLLWSFFFSLATSNTTPLSTQETIITACQTLRTHGYSFFAGILETSAGKLNWNGTGTLFAPYDLAFIGKLRYYPPPLTSLFLYHSIQESLRWDDLQSHSAGTGFITFYHQHCLFLCRSSAGELCISTVNRNPATRFARIRQPNLYIDDKLSVHGIDGILNPAIASPCNPAVTGVNPSLPALEISTTSNLDQAIRSMRRRGYSVLAMTMSMRRNEIKALPTVTVFFPNDHELLDTGEGFHYDFRYHVVPYRLLFVDLARLPSGTRIDTLLTGKSIVVNSDEGAVRLNGVSLTQPEIYHNSWMVIHEIPRPFQISDSLDDSTFWRTPVAGNQPPYENTEAVIAPATTRGYDSAISANAPTDPTSGGDHYDSGPGFRSSVIADGSLLAPAFNGEILTPSPPFQIFDSFDGSVISGTPVGENQAPSANKEAVMAPAATGDYDSRSSVDVPTGPPSDTEQFDSDPGLRSSVIEDGPVLAPVVTGKTIIPSPRFQISDNLDVSATSGSPVARNQTPTENRGNQVPNENTEVVTAAGATGCYDSGISAGATPGPTSVDDRFDNGPRLRSSVVVDGPVLAPVVVGETPTPSPLFQIFDTIDLSPILGSPVAGNQLPDENTEAIMAAGDYDSGGSAGAPPRPTSVDTGFDNGPGLVVVEGPVLAPVVDGETLIPSPTFQISDSLGVSTTSGTPVAGNRVPNENAEVVEATGAPWGYDSGSSADATPGPTSVDDRFDSGPRLRSSVIVDGPALAPVVVGEILTPSPHFQISNDIDFSTISETPGAGNPVPYESTEAVMAARVTGDHDSGGSADAPPGPTSVAPGGYDSDSSADATAGPTSIDDLFDSGSRLRSSVIVDCPVLSPVTVFETLTPFQISNAIDFSAISETPGAENQVPDESTEAVMAARDTGDYDSGGSADTPAGPTSIATGFDSGPGLRSSVIVDSPVLPPVVAGESITPSPSAGRGISAAPFTENREFPAKKLHQNDRRLAGSLSWESRIGQAKRRWTVPLRRRTRAL